MPFSTETLLKSSCKRAEAYFRFSGDEGWDEYVSDNPICWVRFETKCFGGPRAARVALGILVRAFDELGLGQVTESSSNMNELSLTFELKGRRGSFQKEEKKRMQRVIKCFAQYQLQVALDNPFKQL